MILSHDVYTLPRYAHHEIVRARVARSLSCSGKCASSTTIYPHPVSIYRWCTSACSVPRNTMRPPRRAHNIWHDTQQGAKHLILQKVEAMIGITWDAPQKWCRNWRRRRRWNRWRWRGRWRRRGMLRHAQVTHKLRDALRQERLVDTNTKALSKVVPRAVLVRARIVMDIVK